MKPESSTEQQRLSLLLELLKTADSLCDKLLELITRLENLVQWCETNIPRIVSEFSKNLLEKEMHRMLEKSDREQLVRQLRKQHYQKQKGKANGRKG